MAYIETHQSLFTHRKTLRLARLLQLDTFAVVGRLMALWCWALDNAPDGEIPKHDLDLLDTVMSAGCPPDVLCNALVTSGFLDETSDTYVIHDWFDYAGKLIEKRKADAERKRRARANPGNTAPPAPSDTPQSVRRTSAGHPRDGAGTVPYRTLPYPTRERESVRARDVGDLSSTSASEPEHNESLSLSREKTSGTAEAEAEQPTESRAAKVMAPVPPAPDEHTSIPDPVITAAATDPVATRDTAHALYDAWCQATGSTPKSHAERRSWTKALTEMARDVGLSPPDCAPLVAQYRAKLGNDKTPTPGQVAAIYSQLGVSPHVQSLVQPHQRRVAQNPALTPEEYATARQALIAARNGNGHGAGGPISASVSLVGDGSHPLS